MVPYILVGVFVFVVVNLLLALSTTYSPIPYFPTQSSDLRLIVKSLNLSKNDILFDLGSGDGKILLSAARLTPMKKGVGVEIHPFLVTLSNIRAFWQGASQVHTELKSIFKTNLDEATVIYLYVGNKMMPSILEYISKTPHPKLVRLVSYMYDFSDNTPLTKKFKKTVLQGKNKVFVLEKD